MIAKRIYVALVSGEAGAGNDVQCKLDEEGGVDSNMVKIGTNE